MQQSTIYHRHEKRQARSLAQKNDSRPAPIRVLSQIPLFNNIVEPYRNEDTNEICSSMSEKAHPSNFFVATDSSKNNIQNKAPFSRHHEISRMSIGMENSIAGVVTKQHTYHFLTAICCVALLGRGAAIIEQSAKIRLPVAPQNTMMTHVMLNRGSSLFAALKSIRYTKGLIGAPVAYALLTCCQFVVNAKKRS